MAAELVGGAALGAFTSELLRGTISILKDIKNKDKNLRLLERHLHRLEPCIEEVSSKIKRQDGHPARIWLNDLEWELEAAKEFMASLRNTSTGPVLHARLSRKLVPINVRVSELMHDAVVTSWASTLSTVDNLTQVRAEDRMVLDDIKAAQELSYLKQGENWSRLEQNLGEQAQVRGTQDQVWARQARILRKLEKVCGKLEKVCGKLEKVSGKLEHFFEKQEQIWKEEDTFRRLVLQAINSETSNVRARESESAAFETSDSELMDIFPSSADRVVCQPQGIPWRELYIATNKFDDGNIIGKGAFGVVYRGLLGDEEVAVKRLWPSPNYDLFQAELRVHMKISKHPNLVELKGASCSGSDTCMVYELMERGDLHDLLWPERSIVQAREEAGTARILTWTIIEKIAQGIAKGVDYLHRGLSSNGQIFHLDLKPRNILLMSDLTPKITDFGISQMYNPGDTIDITTVRGGTFGYMAPEILLGCLLPTTKMDVFAYGVVLMQLISGRRIDDGPPLVQWARNLVDGEDPHPDELINKHLLELVQPEFHYNFIQNCRKMIDLAMDCTEADPDRRPEMVDILQLFDTFEEVRELESSTPGIIEYSKS